jgi:hypothetical protein
MTVATSNPRAVAGAAVEGAAAGAGVAGDAGAALGGGADGDGGAVGAWAGALADKESAKKGRRTRDNFMRSARATGK